MPRTPPEIILDQVQREQLKALTRASSANQAEVLRARIILLAALNRTNEEIADALQTTEQTVCKWRRRFARHGLAGLQDAARVGRPARVADSALNTVLTQVTQPPKGRGRSSWRSMAQQAGVSKSRVQQLWFRNELKPHQTRTFKLSNDQQFEQKFWDIVGLYLSPPQQAVMLCCDEKTQCQALERSQPGLSLGQGHVTTRTHDFHQLDHILHGRHVRPIPGDHLVTDRQPFGCGRGSWGEARPSSPCCVGERPSCKSEILSQP